MRNLIISQHVNKRNKPTNKTSASRLTGLERVARRKVFSVKPVSPPETERNRSRPLFGHLVKASVPAVSGFLVIVLCVYAVSNMTLSAKSSRLPVEIGTESEIVPAGIETGEEEASDAPDKGQSVSENVKTLKVFEYKVKKGDSLALIAKRYGLNMDTVISYNGIKTARSIVPGTKLIIPNANGIKYTVGKGDCLSCIANRYKVSLNAILDWNDLKTGIIKAGTTLFIPGVRMGKSELNKVLGLLFIWPVKGLLSSSYGYRIHPIDGTRSFHNGLDISGSEGMQIKAAMAGKILKVGKNFLYGNYVIIGHDDGLQTLYGHLSEAIAKQGSYVEQGSIIALQDAVQAANHRPVETMEDALRLRVRHGSSAARPGSARDPGHA